MNYTKIKFEIKLKQDNNIYDFDFEKGDFVENAETKNTQFDNIESALKAFNNNIDKIAGWEVGIVEFQKVVENWEIDEDNEHNFVTEDRTTVLVLELIKYLKA